MMTMNNMLKKLQKLVVAIMLGLLMSAPVSLNIAAANADTNQQILIAKITGTTDPTKDAAVDAAVDKTANSSNQASDKASSVKTNKPTTLETFNVSKFLHVEGQNTSQFNQNEKVSPIIKFILKVIDILVKILGSVAMLVLIIGGIIMIASGGNEQQLETGKNTLKYGIIGLAVALSSFLIITFVNNFLSIK